MSTVKYPAIPTALSGYTRDVRGASIADPYHGLENLEDSSVHEWALAQDRIAGQYLRDGTDAAICEQWLRDHTSPVAPVWRTQRGDFQFYFRMAECKAQPQVYRRSSSEDESCVLDLNGGDEVLHPLLMDVSPSGRYLVYCSAPMGEPMVYWHVLDLQRGELVERSPYAGIEPRLAWLPDESAYYYCVCRELFVTDPDPADGVYLHQLGGDWSQQDECVFAYPGAEGRGHIATPYMSADNAHLVVLTSQFSSGHSGLVVIALDDSSPYRSQALTYVIEDTYCFNRIVGFADNRLYLHTCLNAPNGAVAEIDLDQPQQRNWRTVVPEQPLSLAKPEQFISPDKSVLLNDQLYLCYVEDAHDIIRQYTVDGEFIQEIRLPEYSTIDAVYPVDGETVIFSQSFLRPRAAWRCVDGKAQLIDALSLAVAVPDVEISQQFYRAADGTRIPMYILQQSCASKRQSRPTLLYAYGGFGQTIAPEFTADAALWLSKGGVYALANIRGGGEYGEAWHEAARGANRQTAFDDFHAAAEYLIDQRYTARSQLAIKGVSNGGLLSAVALNQRPELFAAVVSEVPLVDMFWMIDSGIGGALSAEYGNPYEDDRVLEAMRSYSPLQNVNERTDNPPQLVVVAEKDPSAQPGQIYKYLAARQAVAGDTPVLLRIIYGEGHTNWPWATNCRNLGEQVAFLWHFVGRAR